MIEYTCLRKFYEEVLEKQVLKKVPSSGRWHIQDV